MLNAKGTLLAANCQVPPAFVPAAGRVMPSAAFSVRLVKFTSSVALESVPWVLDWFVGAVWTTLV